MTAEPVGAHACGRQLFNPSANDLMANGLGGSVSTSLFVDNQRDAVIPMTGVCLIVKGLI